MNISIPITLIVAMAISAAPRRAEAGQKERAFVAGAIGGVLISNAVHSNRSYSNTSTHYTTYRSSSSCGSRIVVSRPTSNYTPYNSRYIRHETVVEAPPSGHYEIRQRKVWVPGYTQKYREPCGRWVVRRVPGYYTVRNEKVWVEDRTYIRRSHPTTRIVYVR